MIDQPSSGRANTGASGQPRQLTWWRRILLRIVTPILVGFVKLGWASVRIELRGEEKYRKLVETGQPVVFALWHEGIMVIGWYVARLLAEGVKATFLISPSVDGEIGVEILARFGGKAVRGSARRSGAAALRGLSRAIRVDGQSPCITLDGSKGPHRYCKPGAISVARMSGAPIVPIGCAAERSWRMPTWDRHLVPKPFSKVVIWVGDPYEVPRKLDEDGQETQRSELGTKVNRLMKKAEELAGTAPGDAPAIDTTEEDR